MKPVIFHEKAIAEVHEAAAWYERQRPGLGAKFRLALEAAVARIQQNPQIGLPYRATPFRYCLVRRFPYVLFFGEGAHTLRVLAVAHGRRRPGYWQSRGTE
jgi:toxin ParE1/3/4